MGTKENLKIDVYHKSISTSELRELRNSLAKIANQRLRNIEKASSKVTGESYTTYGAYITAQDYLSKQGRKRFTATDSKNKFSRSELQREITALQGFLTSKTSSVRGYRAVESARQKTFKEKGIKFANTKEFYDFLNSGEFAGLRKAISSDKIIDKYDEMREAGLSHEDIINALNDYRGNVSRVSIKSFNKAMSEATTLAGS